MTTEHDDDVLAAALIQIAEHAERITDLDTRETSHHHDTATRLDTLTSTLGHHAAVIKTVDELHHHVTAIADKLTEDGNADSTSYQPAPPPRWWRMTDAERRTATDRLRAWVEQVYQPGYGHLAAALPPCWEHHPLCLYTLDWLSELWSALYLNPERTPPTLGAQAEWQTRLLPAAASQMARETSSCRHGMERQPRPLNRSANPAAR